MKLYDNEGNERDFFWEVSKHAGHLRLSHLSRHLALFEIYKNTLNLPGSVAEFGLYHGSTFFFLARLIEIFHASEHEVHHSASRHLYGFESFEGFAEILPEDKAGINIGPKEVGGLKADSAVFFDTFETFKRDCRVAERLHVIKGNICDTFKIFLEENAGVRLAFALVDFDLYDPTKAVLDRLHDIMVPGGIIVFDEYGFPDWPGETRAVDGFVKRHNLKLKALPWSFAPGAYCEV